MAKEVNQDLLKAIQQIIHIEVPGLVSRLRGGEGGTGGAGALAPGQSILGGAGSGSTGGTLGDDPTTGGGSGGGLVDYTQHFWTCGVDNLADGSTVLLG